MIKQIHAQYPVTSAVTVDTLIRNQAKLISALKSLTWWFNKVTSPKMNVEWWLKRISIVTELYPYKPFNKPVYRVFNTNKRYKAGDRVRMATGLKALQSWTVSAESATNFRGYLGNEKDTVLVRLISPGHEVMNDAYLLDVLAKLRAACRKSDDLELLHDACRVLRVVFSRNPGLIDEKEVIMLLPPQSLVEVIKVWPKYNRN